ncbi:hypothetical protein C2E23DRAFT_859379 [Lenzites betulinus]|nr:hypothetical protein C2E23DRAFT_859379 [Lenzites betulinus]
MDLPLDITHDILTYLPDFRSLFAAIEVSKAFYHAFRSHPRLIIRRVAQNVAGAGCHLAVRAAYCEQQCLISTELVSLPDEEHFRGAEWTFTRGMGNSVEQFAQAVKTIEDFYSIRFKDRTSSTSVLDATEALRFQRAAYRFLLYTIVLWHADFRAVICQCTPLPKYASQHEDMDEDEDEDNEDEDEDQNEDQNEEDEFYEEWVPTPHEKRLEHLKDNFLESLSSEELLELLAMNAIVADFDLWQQTAWGDNAFNSHHMPVGILQLDHRFSERTVPSRWAPYENPEIPMIAHVATKILQARATPHDRLHVVPSAILTSVHGDKDTCTRCAAESGVQLLGAPNMHLLPGLLSYAERALLLPGRLPRYVEEVRALADHLRDSAARVSEGVFVGGLMDMQPADEDADAAADNEQWDKDAWYCLRCIEHLFRQRLVLWWREEKRKAGTLPELDCWYGYNCRTMTHNAAHGAKLNHLCKPDRGDAPEPPPPVVALAPAPAPGNVDQPAAAA